MTIRGPVVLKAGVVLAVASLALVAYRGWQLANAAWTVGQVQQVSGRNDRCGTKTRHACTEFTADVSYEVGGRTYWLQEPAGSEKGHDQPIARASLHIGSRLDIAYDPGAPADHYNGGWHVVPMIGFVAFVMGATLIGLGLKTSRTRDAPRHGGGYDPQDEAPIALGLSRSTNEGATVTDADITTLFGSHDPGLRTDAERAAHAKGYSDYRKHAGDASPSVVRPAFDPPTGCEPAYRAGWNAARSDVEAERRAAAALLT